MDGQTFGLMLTAVGVAFVHTVTGPDHYVPFVALAKARGWTMRRTLWITTLCGIGHVASSVVLGGAGIALGAALGAMQDAEGNRGTVAAWVMFGLGLAYTLWGVRQALRNRGGHAHLFRLQHHHHPHDHDHEHPHDHDHAHLHPHVHLPPPVDPVDVRRTTTFWALFLVFVLGPCEPLIPLFVVPASEHRWGDTVLICVSFGVVTLLTMLGITAFGVLGMARLPLGSLQRWAHALAGSAITVTASAVLFFGL